MAQSNEEIILNQGSLQKKEYKNIIICERCKNNKSNLFCEECQPFHNYCNQCDTAVHSLPSRTNHHRIKIDSYQNLRISISSLLVQLISSKVKLGDMLLKVRQIFEQYPFC